MVLQGESLSELFSEYAQLISRHHSPRAGVKKTAPIGWCSWYAYYADVTQSHVLDNMNHMKGELESLEYVLLDDAIKPLWETGSRLLTNSLLA